MVEAEATATITAELARVDPSRIIYPVTRPPAAPTPFLPAVPAVVGRKRLILNIETEGFRPWEHQIISIGIQDPLVPNELPIVIMHENEAFMVYSLLTVIREGGYNELIVYGGSFDYRFILIKAMKYNFDCKEFYDCKLYDLGQAMAQGKFEFVYFAQKQPKLSDIADYFWAYPKPFTDLEMIKFWKQGQLDKVYEFTSSQITRILALYVLFRRISETPISNVGFRVESATSSSIPPQNIETESKLTIPEANNPEMVTLKCPTCLAEFEVTKEHLKEMCPICGQRLEVIK